MSSSSSTMSVPTEGCFGIQLMKEQERVMQELYEQVMLPGKLELLASSLDPAFTKLVEGEDGKFEQIQGVEAYAEHLENQETPKGAEWVGAVWYPLEDEEVKLITESDAWKRVLDLAKAKAEEDKVSEEDFMLPTVTEWLCKCDVETDNLDVAFSGLWLFSPLTGQLCGTWELTNK